MYTHSQEITLKALSSAKQATPLTTSKAESSEDEGEEESEEEESEGVEDEEAEEGEESEESEEEEEEGEWRQCSTVQSTVLCSDMEVLHLSNHIVDFTIGFDGLCFSTSLYRVFISVHMFRSSSIDAVPHSMLCMSADSDSVFSTVLAQYLVPCCACELFLIPWSVLY